MEKGDVFENLWAKWRSTFEPYTTYTAAWGWFSMGWEKGDGLQDKNAASLTPEDQLEPRETDATRSRPEQLIEAGPIGLDQDSVELMQKIFDLVKAERVRQVEKWGFQDHIHSVWLCILTEEIGEVAEAVLKGNRVQMVKELIQSAAVIVAWLERVLEDEL